MDDPGATSYTTKELVAEIHSRLVAIDSKLDHKAEYEDLRSVRHRVTAIENLGPLLKRIVDEFDGLRADVDSLKDFRSQTRGALAIVVALVIAISGRVLGAY